MESLLTLIEDNPILKKWINSCRLERDLYEFCENAKNNFSNEKGMELKVPNDLSDYVAGFKAVNEKNVALKALRAEESKLMQEIAQLETDVEKAKKVRKNIIIAVVFIVLSLVIYLMF